VPATGLADVGIGDAHPLVLGGGVEHASQQLAVLSLQLLLLLEGQPGSRDPIRQGVAHALQLPQAGDPRFAVWGRDAGVDLDPGERLDHEA